MKFSSAFSVISLVKVESVEAKTPEMVKDEPPRAPGSSRGRDPGIPGCEKGSRSLRLAFSASWAAMF